MHRAGWYTLSIGVLWLLVTAAPAMSGSWPTVGSVSTLWTTSPSAAAWEHSFKQDVPADPWAESFTQARSPQTSAEDRAVAVVGLLQAAAADTDEGRALRSRIARQLLDPSLPDAVLQTVLARLGRLNPEQRFPEYVQPILHLRLRGELEAPANEVLGLYDSAVLMQACAQALAQPIAGPDAQPALLLAVVRLLTRDGVLDPARRVALVDPLIALLGRADPATHVGLYYETLAALSAVTLETVTPATAEAWTTWYATYEPLSAEERMVRLIRAMYDRNRLLTQQLGDRQVPDALARINANPRDVAILSDYLLPQNDRRILNRSLALLASLAAEGALTPEQITALQERVSPLIGVLTSPGGREALAGLLIRFPNGEATVRDLAAIEINPATKVPLIRLLSENGRDPATLAMLVALVRDRDRQPADIVVEALVGLGVWSQWADDAGREAVLQVFSQLAGSLTPQDRLVNTFVNSLNRLGMRVDTTPVFTVLLGGECLSREHQLICLNQTLQNGVGREALREVVLAQESDQHFLQNCLQTATRTQVLQVALQVIQGLNNAFVDSPAIYDALVGLLRTPPQGSNGAFHAVLADTFVALGRAEAQQVQGEPAYGVLRAPLLLLERGLPQVALERMLTPAPADANPGQTMANILAGPAWQPVLNAYRLRCRLRLPAGWEAVPAEYQAAVAAGMIPTEVQAADVVWACALAGRQGPTAEPPVGLAERLLTALNPAGGEFPNALWEAVAASMQASLNDPQLAVPQAAHRLLRLADRFNAYEPLQPTLALEGYPGIARYREVMQAAAQRFSEWRTATDTIWQQQYLSPLLASGADAVSESVRAYALQANNDLVVVPSLFALLINQPDAVPEALRAPLWDLMTAVARERRGVPPIAYPPPTPEAQTAYTTALRQAGYSLAVPE